MKAIVGLGNPGPKYRGTRHNIGFAVVDELARRAARRVRVGAGRGADREGGAESTTLLLAKPLTFMNPSGQAVGELLRYFKIDPADLLVVVDEVQLPLGEAAGAGARIGRRAQRAEVDRSRTSATSSRGCGSASGAATRGATWRITCSRGSTPTKRRRSSA